MIQTGFYCLQKEMEAAGVKPDVVTYTALMAVVVKTGPYRGRSSPTQRWAHFTLQSVLLPFVFDKLVSI